MSELDQRDLERGPTGDHGQKGDKGDKGDTGGIGKPAPIHPWRWRLLAGWIAIFSFVTVMALHNSATVDDLQRTNCGLRNFLLTAQQLRQDAADRADNEQERKENQKAADGYVALLEPFTAESIGPCPWPENAPRR